MRLFSSRQVVVGVTAIVAAFSLAVQTAGPALDQLDTGLTGQLLTRIAIAQNPVRPSSQPIRVGSMTPAERRVAIDTIWGDGPSTAEKLAIFDKFWDYADAKFAAFQHLDVNWRDLRSHYRGEVAGGVSRGRFAAIINQLSLALRDSHTHPLDSVVNVFTVPQPGVPLLGLSGWGFDPSGACSTAQDDGSALVYSAIPGHPLGLQRGDRILGYDGHPWPELYQQMLHEELPLWPLWWGTSPSSFEHTFVMSAAMNWSLFDTMDVVKAASGQTVHVSTALMPHPIFWGFCSEQLNIPGVSKPAFTASDLVHAGIIDGTRIGYIYSWSWAGSAVDQFADAVNQLTQVEQVDGLILDFRFNLGGVLGAPFQGLGALAPYPSPTLGMDVRKNPADHFAMISLAPVAQFKLDFINLHDSHARVKAAYAGPVAVLVGPGAVSAGDFAALWATSLPRVRTFGKSTSMALGLPTQPVLGTELDLGPDWEQERIDETNSYLVGAPKDFLIHTEFPVDERVWMVPADIAVGKDTVVEAALQWLHHQLGQ